MSSIALAWHILRSIRVTLSLVLFLAVIRRRIYKEFPLFAVYAGWITLGSIAVMFMNYAPFVNGHQLFVGTTISNGVGAILAFAVIYQMLLGEPPFTGALRHHGWRIGKVTLPSPPRGTDPTVVAPAEVELA